MGIFFSSVYSQQNNCCQKFQILSSTGTPIADCIITIKTGNDVVSTCRTGSSGTCEICDLKPGIQYTALITECCSISGTPTSFKCDENEVVTIVCNSDK